MKLLLHVVILFVYTTYQSIADKFCCSPGLVHKVLQRAKEGEFAPRKHGTSHDTLHTFHTYKPILQNYADEGIPLKQFAPTLQRETGVQFHPSTIYRNAHKQLDLSLQKGMKLLLQHELALK